jgi:hypothetical protein
MKTDRGLFLYETQILLIELLPRFLMRRVFGDACHRTNRHALRFLEVASTFGTAFRIDDVNLHTLGDGLVGTLRFAGIAIDTLEGNQQGHKSTLEKNRLERLYQS